jgi:hypothetical protein
MLDGMPSASAQPLPKIIIQIVAVWISRGDDCLPSIGDANAAIIYLFSVSSAFECSFQAMRWALCS